MRGKNTKQVIADKALELFSQRGYQGVTVADIAEAVGIKAASLYKHYPSKQQIFDSLLRQAANNYQRFAGTLGLDGTAFEKDVERFAQLDTESLVEAGMAMFLFFLHDETTAKLRRMMTIEQYANKTASQLLIDQYIDLPLNYQSALLGVFKANGLLNDVDCDMAAAHFYSPLYLMLVLCDNAPEREEEAMDFLKRHVTQFKKLYIKGE